MEKRFAEVCRALFLCAPDCKSCIFLRFLKIPSGFPLSNTLFYIKIILKVGESGVKCHEVGKNICF